ncbi:MAG: tyrosine--tRNA ligase [Gammaproteobacteria bacterium]|nr:tyrosine--tRNA ligase [Gammaproteobacteria bacterium]
MLIDDLKARGLATQTTDEGRLRSHLAGGMRTLYCGFDPTADSLHIGSLVPLLTLRRFQLAGHRPILLLGGATGLIGDPSGRDAERGLNDIELVAEWMGRIERQVEPFLELGGETGARIENNLEWTRELDVISYLRDVGKFFSVNAMVGRESVRSRLRRDGEGISYTEFSYMLLQANDYLELAQRHGCSLQIGGSDQWGNIVSGIDLVRRRLGREAHALTVPLVTRADGVKFGKTAAGAVWLDPEKTSPYAFYQFWLNVADADAVSYLRLFTLLDLAAIVELAEAVDRAPERREAQAELAGQVTQLVHGTDGLSAARRISECLFGGDPKRLQRSDLRQLELGGVEGAAIPERRVGLLAALVACGLASSRGAARQLVAAKGVSVNGRVCDDPGHELDFADALYGRYYLLRRGKRNWGMLTGPD